MTIDEETTAGPFADLSQLLAVASAQLATAGVASPRHDAETLAAHVLDVPRSRLALIGEVDPIAQNAISALVERRAAREPLQHLTGLAPFRHLELAVGPGVFIPRPETEGLVDLVLPGLAPRARVIDLCAGSGALALAIAQERPDLTVGAVENDPGALTWLRRNAAESAVTVHGVDVVAITAGDCPGALGELAGRVDLVVSNPPYLPTGLDLEPEVVAYDPSAALWGGTDGLAVIRAVITAAHWLLVPGGTVALEHDASHQPAVLDLLDIGGFTAVRGHQDLAGRDRYATGARMAP